MQLRDYQQEIFDKVVRSYSDDLVQLDTGAGKTPIEAAIAQHYPYVMLLAHRNILIAQMSEKMAAFGIKHDTVSTEQTRRRCASYHLRAGFESHIFRGNSNKIAVSIGSLVSHYKRGLLNVDRMKPWVIVIDEAHHVQPDNQWGSLREIFPSCRIIGFTATPARGDGGCLHISNGGLFDRLVQADELADDSVVRLISLGFLCNFSAYSPAYANAQSAKRVILSADPVQMLRKLEKKAGRSLKVVLFAPTIINAKEFSEEFRSAGYPSAHISSKQGVSETSMVIDAYKDGRVQVLCNCDMVSEGFDLPDIDAIFLCKFTKSFVMFRQWCGRVLRPSPGKDQAYIVDFTGNIELHGQPDMGVRWDIENPPKGLGEKKHAPCVECGAWYQIDKPKCPECGAENELLKPRGMGSGVAEIERLVDGFLLAKERRKIAMQKIESEMSESIVWPSFSDGSDLIGKMIGKLRAWAVNASVDAVGFVDINKFLRSPECRDREFWISRFQMSDIGKSDAKAKKVIKEWVKNDRDN